MQAEKLVAVSTFCSWASYGSMLQAYALKQTLKKLGYDSYILIDRTVITPQMRYRIPKTLNPKTLVSGYLDYRLVPELDVQYLKNSRFIRDNIDIIYYNGYRELELNYLKADYYLTGSDQVFNPNNPQPGFYFDYISEKSKLLTYACSMGTTCVPPEREAVFAKRLRNFKRISVREADNIPVLQKYNPEATYQTNVDPTLLLTAEQWREIEKPYPIEGKYILLYPLYWDKCLNKQIKRLKKASNCKVIGVFASGFNQVACDKKLYDVGVEEFLWLVDHAEAVITSSFHGAVFSSIFEKKVCLVTNPKMPSRMDNLAKMLGIPKCEITQVFSQSIDYSKARGAVVREMEKSVKYLEEMLNGK